MSSFFQKIREPCIKLNLILISYIKEQNPLYLWAYAFQIEYLSILT